MKFKLFIVCLFFNCLFLNSQSVNYTLTQDTMSLPGSGKVLQGAYMETTLKDLSQVRLFRTNDLHIYIRFIVTRNFYFDKVGILEIQTGSKSFYAKEVKQYKITKTSGLFIAEIPSNYLTTLKEGGISGLVFSEAETDFTKQDTQQIKKMAASFYDLSSKK